MRYSWNLVGPRPGNVPAGLDLGNSSGNRRLDTPLPEYTSIVPYCRPGHRGPLCEACEDGFYKVAQQGCARCSADASTDVGNVVLNLFLFFLAITAAGAVVLMYQRRAMRKLREQGESAVKTGGILWLQDQVVKIKILLGLAQVASSFGITFTNIFPVSVLNLMHSIGILGLDFTTYLSFGCAATVNHYTQMVTSCLTPVLLLAVLWLFDFLTRRFSHNANARLDVRRGVVTAAVWIFFLIYPSVSAKVFQTFPCTEFEDGTSALRADYSIDCKAPERTAWIAFAVLMVFLYPIGVPLWFFVILRKEMKKINPPGEDRELICAQRDVNPDIAHLRVLFYAYEPVFWYWEVVELGRKLMVTSVVVFFLDGTVTQIVLTMLISMAYLALQAQFRPYNEDTDDNLATIAQWGLIITLLAGLMYKIDASQQDGYSSSVYAALIYISLIIPPASAVMEAVLEALPMLAFIYTCCLSKQTLAVMDSRKKTKRPSQIMFGKDPGGGGARPASRRPSLITLDQATGKPIRVYLDETWDVDGDAAHPVPARADAQAAPPVGTARETQMRVVAEEKEDRV
jgi:hypothetical protein